MYGHTFFLMSLNSFFLGTDLEWQRKIQRNYTYGLWLSLGKSYCAFAQSVVSALTRLVRASAVRTDEAAL